MNEPRSRALASKVPAVTLGFWIIKILATSLSETGGIAAARVKGKIPGRRPLDLAKAASALKLVEHGVSPTDAARQLGLGRATVYREMAVAGVRRGELPAAANAANDVGKAGGTR